MPRTARTPPATAARLAPLKRLAGETGIPYTSWRDIAFRGEIEVVKVGRAWFVERTDVDRWIAAHKEKLGA